MCVTPQPFELIGLEPLAWRGMAPVPVVTDLHGRCRLLLQEALGGARNTPPSIILAHFIAAGAVGGMPDDYVIPRPRVPKPGKGGPNKSVDTVAWSFHLLPWANAAVACQISDFSSSFKVRKMLLEKGHKLRARVAIVVRTTSVSSCREPPPTPTFVSALPSTSALSIARYV
ncbi:hypothetical protein K470DRAFT_1675 [Piedraia hortae CBS 480.64]|uniref:Uncharacterized protein n=1 Tax=Piedraia hortae CBS 480.64 TaxID=1314780 RepID=A0A6A7CBA8_9PEZI|nr:hypothetical protein K470DRAFT_1675 [Piedraia hortae CBS 480.64]